eukprot:187599-Pleurochrysis_carterae.AAC.2
MEEKDQLQRQKELEEVMKRSWKQLPCIVSSTSCLRPLVSARFHSVWLSLVQMGGLGSGVEPSPCSAAAHGKDRSRRIALSDESVRIRRG